MNTYSHAFFTWLVAKHGVRGPKSGRAAGIAGAVGATLPDLPSVAGAVYYWGKRDEMPRESLLDAVYFTGPFGGTGSAMHSLMLPATLLLSYWLLGLGGTDRRGIILWLLIGWAGHTVADFLTHAEDTRPLFWPISGWEWSSPVSYYDPAYYGFAFTLVSHLAILFFIVLLSVRRLRLRKIRKKRGPVQG